MSLSLNTQSLVQWSYTGSDNTAYLLERSTDSGATWTNVLSCSAATTSYVDNNVWWASSSVYRVSALNSHGQGPTSSYVTVFISSPGIDTPSLSGSLFQHMAALSWSYSGSSQGSTDKLIIERSSDGGSSWAYSQSINSPPLGSSSFVDSTVATNTSYLYRLHAFCNFGLYGGYSNTAPVVTDNGGIPTVTSFILTKVQVWDDSAAIAWNGYLTTATSGRGFTGSLNGGAWLRNTASSVEPVMVIDVLDAANSQSISMKHGDSIYIYCRDSYLTNVSAYPWIAEIHYSNGYTQSLMSGSSFTGASGVIPMWHDNGSFVLNAIACNYIIPAMTIYSGSYSVRYAFPTINPSSITASSDMVGAEAWRAVDNDSGSVWFTSTNNMTQTTHWLEYNQENYTIIQSYGIISQPYNYIGVSTWNTPKTWQFQGYNDVGATWVTLDTQTNVTSWTKGVYKNFSFSNSTPYRRYRLYITDENVGDTYDVQIAEFQMNTCQNTTFVSAHPLIPVMTSNTTPFGTASASTNTSTAWQAFSGSSVKWNGANPTTLMEFQSIQYQFPSPVTALYYQYTSGKIFGHTSTYVSLQGSHDGTTWYSLDSQRYNTGNSTEPYTTPKLFVTSPTASVFYRLFFNSAIAATASFRSVQLYGY